jgi:hypothetical protein
MCLAIAPGDAAGYEIKPHRNGHSGNGNGVHVNGTYTNGRPAPFSLEALAAALTGTPKRSSWQLGCGGTVGLEPTATAAEKRR